MSTVETDILELGDLTAAWLIVENKMDNPAGSVRRRALQAQSAATNERTIR